MEDAPLQRCHVLPPAGRPDTCNAFSINAFMCYKCIIRLYLRESFCVKAPPICLLIAPKGISSSSTCWTDHKSHTHHSLTHNSRGKPWRYDAPVVNMCYTYYRSQRMKTKCMNEAFNMTCNMFCFSHLSGVKPGYREQVVASLPGTMAPATQRVSPLFPPAVCGRTAPNRSVQPQSAAPR